jgi:hypothetical protein
MIFLATDDGLYSFEDRLVKISESYSLNDGLVIRGKIILCSQYDGVIVGNKRVLEESCWRLFIYNNEVLASIEGPRIFKIVDDRARIVLDLTPLGRELGWDFFGRDSHITDLSYFKDLIVATIEEGSLLVGKSLNYLRPLNFSADSHVLLSMGEYLLIGTADGVYYTEDLERFHKTVSGYVHGLISVNNSIVGQVMSETPLVVSHDGRSWSNLGLRLPRPTYGQTCLTRRGDKIIYALKSLYEIKERYVKILVPSIPTVRNVREF